MPEPRIDEFLRLSVHMANVARSTIMKYFRSDVNIEQKADLSPVTIADRKAETAMRALIEEAFPEHGVIGEEFGEHNADAEYVWVIDPIDGTQSFVTGKPLFGILISLTKNGVPILGIIDAPAMSERWIGTKGRHTTFNGSPVKVRPCSGTPEAWLYATTPDMFLGDDLLAFQRLQNSCKRVVYGADCYAYGLLSNGFVDLVCEASLKPYDYCALVPVIKGAGGVITDWEGNALTVNSKDRVLAAGDPGTHAQALKTLAG